MLIKFINTFFSLFASAQDLFAKGDDVYEENVPEAVRYYKRAAIKGHAEAQYKMGELYQLGGSFEGIPQDSKKAMKWYRKSAAQGFAEAQYTLGLYHADGLNHINNYAYKDYEQAKEWFEKAAAQGSEQALYKLAEMYHFGNGAPRDIEKALEMYQQLAEKNYYDALLQLGMYYKGELAKMGNPTPDYAQAADYLQRAIEHRFLSPEAKYELADMYRSGNGVPQDMKKALELYRHAANQGDSCAPYVLGLYYGGYLAGVEETAAVDYDKAIKWLTEASKDFDDAKDIIAEIKAQVEAWDDDVKINMQGLKALESKSDGNAFTLFSRAAEMGNAPAYYNLAGLYYEGTGVQQDIDKAVELFQQAAERGNEDGQFAMGLYYSGNLKGAEDADKDFEKAFELFTQLAEKGNANGQCSLGDMYFDGEGVAQDKAKGVEWWAKAAEQGNEDAQNSMGYAYQHGEGVAQDYVRAFEWFSKAAEERCAASLRHLGELYRDGLGVAQDLEKADWNFHQAVLAGSEKAKEDLFALRKSEMDKLNLKTRDDLFNLIKSYTKPATKMVVKDNSPVPDDCQLRSHFFGNPYFEKSEKWPKGRNGKKLEFMFQVFNDTDIALPQNIRLLQFYLTDNDVDDLATETKDDGWLVKVYENLKPENRVFIKNPDKNRDGYYREIEFKPILSLPSDWDDVYDVKNIKKLSYLLNTEYEDPRRYFFEVAREVTNDEYCKTQLGGYPHWIQSDDSPDEDGYEFLFSVDSLDIHRHWYDCGRLYVHYNNVTKKAELSLQYC